MAAKAKAAKQAAPKPPVVIRTGTGPVPQGDGRSRYPWASLGFSEVDEQGNASGPYFWVAKPAKALQCLASKTGKQMGCRFVVRHMELDGQPGTAVWRLEA